jgi:hypothetical protein
MISHTNLNTILNCNTELSRDGRIILEQALALGKAFAIVPALDREILTALIEKGVEVVPLSPADFAAITDQDAGQQHYKEMIATAHAENCMVGSYMGVYPDEEFDRLPDRIVGQVAGVKM